MKTNYNNEEALSDERIHGTRADVNNQTALPVADGLISVTRTTSLPIFARPAHDREASRYGANPQTNWAALAGSISMVAALLSAFAAVDIVKIHMITQPSTVIELLPEQLPVTPPPPHAKSKPVEIVKSSTPIVMPTPLVTTPAQPVQIATVPVPSPPEVSVSGPPSPTLPATAPTIESVGDLSSKMIEATPPRYPVDSRRKHEEGTVILMVTLGIDGRAANIAIAHTSGFDRLDRAALEAVRRWHWSPTLRGGTPVMVRGQVEIPFMLTR